MKKILALTAFIILMGCSKDEIYEPIYLDTIPKVLEIADVVGIKLESKFATEEIPKSSYKIELFEGNTKVGTTSINLR